MAGEGRDNVLQLVKTGEPDGAAAAIAKLREAVPQLVELNRVLAKVQREAYLAYLREGFTPAQALELCKGARP